MQPPFSSHNIYIIYIYVLNLPVGDIDIVYSFCLVTCHAVSCSAMCSNVSFVYGSRSPACVLLLPNLFTACAWFNPPTLPYIFKV